MNSSCGVTRAILLLSHSFSYESWVFCLAALSQQQTCASRGPLDEAHHTEQRGTQKSPDAEIHYMCRRRDLAELACVRAAALVDRRAGRCGARARPEPELFRGSRWTTVQRRIVGALRLLLGVRVYPDA